MRFCSEEDNWMNQITTMVELLQEWLKTLLVDQYPEFERCLTENVIVCGRRKGYMSTHNDVGCFHLFFPFLQCCNVSATYIFPITLFGLSIDVVGQSQTTTWIRLFHVLERWSLHTMHYHHV